MIHAFYFRFLRMTRIRWLSETLAYLAYFLLFLVFLVKKIWTRPQIVDMDKNVAEDRIAAMNPDPGKEPELVNQETDDRIDLSVIIPVYNYAELIDGCIRTILNQKTDYKYEVILVDDGSTDGSGKVLENYRGFENVKIISQQNQGIAGARNTGLNHAVGKYVMFIDCDDTVKDNIIETLMSEAVCNDLDMVMCGHELVKERDGKPYETLTNIYPEHNLMGYPGNAAILNYPGLPWCKVYKRELWKNVRFFPGYWNEDTIIHSLLFTQCSSYTYRPVSCYRYRWYEKNYSHVQGQRNNPKCTDYYWIMKHILEKTRELSLPADERFETMLSKHLSAYFYREVCGMEDDVLESLFVLACALYKEYGTDIQCRLPYVLRLSRKALVTQDFSLWKLSSGYQR